MIYNLSSAKNLYYPESIELTWLAKLTQACKYIGIGYNGQYHNFKGVDWIAKDVFFVMMPNYSNTKTGWNYDPNIL